MDSTSKYDAQLKARMYDSKGKIFLNSPIILQMSVNINVPYS